MKTQTLSTQSKGGTVWAQLPDDWDLLHCLRRLNSQPHCLCFDSAMPMERVGRFSFAMADPIDWIEIAANEFDSLGQQPFAPLRQKMAQYDVASIENLPPFQGGAAGMISYELGRSFESIKPAAHDEFTIPLLAFGIFDTVLAWDHPQGTGWIISQGFPESDEASRRARAIDRVEHFSEILAAPATEQNRKVIPLDATELFPQFPTDRLSSVTSDFSAGDYQQAVQKAIDYIYAGDVFQVNLSQRLLMPATRSSYSLYESLRQYNPAPFAAYFDLGSVQLLSASPERLLSVRNRQVEARPIKGTRPRTAYPEVDLMTSLQLQSSEKDRAENVMIVDLMRNDLSRVCQDDSVQVTQLCNVESYRSVLHLVSVVEGILRETADVFDLLDATFPGGSVTGAPKIRAMEIIAELERTARGAYCGSLGYIGFDGNADFNILIRTVTAAGGWWQVPVGGGIVAASDPKREYEETWTKAASILHAARAED